jgi:hypothetical protein
VAAVAVTITLAAARTDNGRFVSRDIRFSMNLP